MFLEMNVRGKLFQCIALRVIRIGALRAILGHKIVQLVKKYML